MINDVGSINKVLLIGNLGADPELNYTQAGRQRASFRIATKERWTDAQGQTQERTQWHRIVVWGKLAEICGQHLKKGRRVYVEGRLQHSSYEKEGQTHYSTDVVAQNVVFLDSRGGAAEGDFSQNSSEPRSGGYTGERPSAPESRSGGGGGGYPESRSGGGGGGYPESRSNSGQNRSSSPDSYPPAPPMPEDDDIPF